jgi:phospho-N-acetylmuramoyl-pentapeptide-transferase
MIRFNDPINAAFFVALIVGCIVAPIVYRMLLRLNSRQTISEHVQEHAHKQGTPTMGGLIFLIAWFITVFLVQGTSSRDPVLVVALFAAIGFIDDFVVPRLQKGKRGLGWKQKLIMQIGGCMAILVTGGTSWFTAGIATFVILFMSNAYNFADGMDALAGSLAVFIAAAIGIIAVHAGLDHIGIYMSAIVGAFIPFLFLNAPPARVFMGDVGALPIGALFGHQMVEIAVRSTTFNWLLYLVPFTMLSIVMIAELVPVPIQILSVKLTGKRVFPRTPIHHSFQYLGWPETRVVWMFILVQGVAAWAAVAWVLKLEGGLF